MSSENVVSCALCGYREDLLRCSRCKLIFYCSKEHQKKHWKKHKAECEASSKKSVSTKEEPKTPTKSKLGAPSPITPPKTPVSPTAPPSTPTKYPGTPRRSTVQQNISPSTPSRSSDTFSERSSTSPGETEFTPPRTPLPLEGSSEAEILATSIENLCLSPTTLKFATQGTLKSSPRGPMPVTSQHVTPHRLQFKNFPPGNIHNTYPYLHKTDTDDMVPLVIEDLNSYGLCVLDNFCGPQLGRAALKELLCIYNKGIFQDGQLVAKSKNDAQSIRSDKIMWVDGKEPFCVNIGTLLKKIDGLIMRANKMPNNGKLGQYLINGRTKAMLAVYPGSGTHYVKHVDNPNHDGRCITAIYYLNIDWDVQKKGGLLRIFPENESNTVADIAPLFDRLLFFWSDRQNPHEVQPSYDTRYAITLWYFDATERALATEKFELEKRLRELGAIRTAPTQEQLRIMHQLRQGMILQEQHRQRFQQQKANEQKKKQQPPS
ncbi:hypothetical protein HHI36_000458 [Cryptolaemus montrouzieri]|uniref:hypoxia-inducible factor-proline dioxygenase n=1 Tax=Cryptolaemus montrouzieri TaxID=559131 RepID=A0ABD2P4U9_9CUCU